MSDIFPQVTDSMSALKLNDSPHDETVETSQLPLTVVPRSLPQLEPGITHFAKIPRLPEDYATCKRYYFLGWHVTDEGLKRLAIDNKFPKAFWCYSSFDGIRYIAWKSGYHFAYSAAGVVEEGEHFEGQYPGQGNDTVVRIIMIYVNKRAYAHRRPTAPQLARLTRIFGSDPRWFKDARQPRDFEDYQMWEPILKKHYAGREPKLRPSATYKTKSKGRALLP